MMKKITLFLAAVLLTAMSAFSQTLNNPKDANGFYIVKWDCANDTWATSNSFEVDETFTFAVDVTGTPFEAWLKATPTAAGATRSLAINKWTGFGDVNGNTNRMKLIKGNIYGATWNLVQMATTMDVASATTIGAITYLSGQVFGYEYTSDNPGAGWWMWPDGVAGGTAIDPGTPSGAIFGTLPYTGTKTSAEFYNDDYGNELFGTDYPEKGYAPACAIITSIGDVPTVTESPIVGHEYYSLQGQKLLLEPKNGLYIDKAIRADGSTSLKKILKNLE